MSEEQYESMAESASKFGRAVMESHENLEANVDLFRRAIQQCTPDSEALARGTVR
jgi:hypothetical protein